MGGGGGNFFEPKNLIPTILTGGFNYTLAGAKKLLTPPPPPDQPQPPKQDPGAYPHALDQNPTETAAQRQKKLAALQYGFASTMTAKSNSPTGSLGTPMATALKTKTGQ